MIVKSVVGVDGIRADQSYATCNTSGAVYWNAACQKFTVYDGSRSEDFYSVVQSVGLNPNVIDKLEWVAKKMQQEEKLDELCKQHPGLKEARETYELMLKMCE
jgi:hypothetical protein